MGRAFPPHPGCPVPSVSAITGELVSSCRIDPPADPIYNFPIFSFPIPNPPSYNFGCYRPSARTTVALNQPVPYFSATVKFPRSSDTGNCEPNFRFNIGFPAANCPDISASGSIHLLPPGHSPSLSLKVHKSSAHCGFNFKLTIGIPGGECTSVSAGSDDAPPPPDLQDGDDFEVLTGVTVTTDDSGACTEYKLQFNRVDFTLDILNGAFDVHPNAGVDPDCCTQFTVVSAITGWTYPARGAGVMPTLQFTTKHITIPKIVFNADTIDSETVACDGTITAMIGLTPSDDDTCTPCGQVFNRAVRHFNLTPPTLTLTPMSGTALTLTGGGGTVVTAVEKDTGSTDCAQEIDVFSATITSGGLAGTNTATLVCDVTCSSTSLVVKKQTLTFINGILTSLGSCA